MAHAAAERDLRARRWDAAARIHRRTRRGGARDRGHGLRHAPRRARHAAHVARQRRREQVVRHRLQDPARRRHGRLPHPRALRAVRQRPLPGQGALRQPAQILDADLPERPHLLGQDHVPGREHQRAGPAQPYGRLHGRGAAPHALPQEGNLRAGGVALRGRGGRRGRSPRAPLQRRRAQRDEGGPGRPRRGRPQPPERRPVPRHRLRARVGGQPARHPPAHLRGLPRHPRAPLQPRQRAHRALRRHVARARAASARRALPLVPPAAGRRPQPARAAGTRRRRQRGVHHGDPA